MNVSGSSIATTLGIGSGVDMTGLANQLAEAQFAGRNARLSARAETIERRISLAGSIRAALSQFATALGDRLRSGDLAPKPTISNSSVAAVSAPIGSIAKGTYLLEVTKLASAQTLVGPAYATSDAAVGSGSLTIRFGNTDNAGFTADTARDPLVIDIAAGAKLSDVASAINAKGAGVTAYVAQTEAGAQLVLKGAEGAKNGFVLEATEDPADPGLSTLAWQPGSDPARLIKGSQDAEYKLDGLVRRSTSNTIESAAPGLSLSLTGTNIGAPATISFASTSTSTLSVMQDITGALNEIASELRSATDPKTGDLARDTGARALRRTLASLGTIEIMRTAPEGSPRTLAELGLAIERDGSFRFDAARFNEVVARDPAGVAAMFTNGIDGIYATIDRLARASGVSTDPGSLAGSVARYTSQSQQISREQEKLTEQMEALRATMVARFAKADSRVSDSKSTLSFLQSQIDVWNSQRN